MPGAVPPRDGGHPCRAGNAAGVGSKNPTLALNGANSKNPTLASNRAGM
jgi:hypothetical protein